MPLVKKQMQAPRFRAIVHLISVKSANNLSLYANAIHILAVSLAGIMMMGISLQVLVT